MSHQLCRNLSNLYFTEKDVIYRKEKVANGNRTESMIPKPKDCPGHAGPDSYNIMNAMKLSKDQYNIVTVCNYCSLFMRMCIWTSSMEFECVTLGPGRYRRRLDGSKDRPKGCPLGFQASRWMPGVQRFQRSVDSIVQQRLREIQGKGQ